MYVFYLHNQKSAFTTHRLYGCLSLWFYSCQLPSEKLDSASSFLVAQRKESTCKQKVWVDPWVGEIPWRRKWQSSPIFLPGKFHGQGSLLGYSPWGRKELDMPEWLTLSLSASSRWTDSWYPCVQGATVEEEGQPWPGEPACWWQGSEHCFIDHPGWRHGVQ